MALTFTGTGIGEDKFYQPIPPGILTHVYVTNESTQSQPGQTWCQIQLSYNVGDKYTPEVIIQTGYPSPSSPLVWFGFLTVPKDAQIVFHLSGDLNNTYHADYRRLTQTHIQDLGKFIRELVTS